MSGSLDSWSLEDLGDETSPSTPPWERGWGPTKRSLPWPCPLIPRTGVSDSKLDYATASLGFGTWEIWHLPSFFVPLGFKQPSWNADSPF